MEKAFYPRSDSVNAVVSNLLPRDKSEDILPDQNGDPVYLQRSSILDGTEIRGFGYVDGKPYKWKVEIESAMKSLAVIPDRFFSIYGKSYPIIRRQTIGINQPSESFKYEIIYKRGYDKYNDEPQQAKIIYYRSSSETYSSCSIADTDSALAYLNNIDDYPYLKIRVCLDGSIRAYLGTINVDWDLTRQIDDEHAIPDDAWVEVTSVVNTNQFRGIELWAKFDSINALSYYLITKYENDIFNIGPKEIKGGLPQSSGGQYCVAKYEADSVNLSNAEKITVTLSEGAKYEVWNETNQEWDEETIEPSSSLNLELNTGTLPSTVFVFAREVGDTSAATQKKEELSIFRSIVGPGVTTVQDETTLYRFTKTDDDDIDTIDFTIGFAPVQVTNPTALTPADVAGLDYDLETPEDLSDSDPCTPCCKKDNLSRSIWAYINPRTMVPYDDDYWFHQGEPYYKKSLTLSTKNNPLKAKRIFIEQGTFPGMYKIVGETYIRNRDTGKDERMQFVFPLCKIKSDQTLTLQADGDPTTFNLDVEVAVPQNGVPMEITFYEVEKEMKMGCGDTMVEKDGSTRISAG